MVMFMLEMVYNIMLFLSKGFHNAGTTTTTQLTVSANVEKGKISDVTNLLYTEKT